MNGTVNAYLKVPGRWEGWLGSFLKPAPVRVEGTQEAPSFKEMHRTLGKGRPGGIRWGKAGGQSDREAHQDLGR